MIANKNFSKNQPDEYIKRFRINIGLKFTLNPRTSASTEIILRYRKFSQEELLGGSELVMPNHNERGTMI